MRAVRAFNTLSNWRHSSDRASTGRRYHGLPRSLRRDLRKQKLLTTPFEPKLNQFRRGIVTTAFLGVGAPEAVLVGVVALILFGPKGLAQAAKSLGQGVKALAPTIRELTDISTDLKSTIEDEIGLSEIRDELSSTLSPNPRQKVQSIDPSGEMEEDPEIEAKRLESAKLAWGNDSGAAEREEQKAVESLSLEELEAELKRRKTTENGGLN
ncbi:Sec-independent protein translocase protein TATB [Picochlorum sp. SENEW3]|nr:Sec-independent protein translocase protein TATB [Picochlorum sp. SENEW3]